MKSSLIPILIITLFAVLIGTIIVGIVRMERDIAVIADRFDVPMTEVREGLNAHSGSRVDLLRCVKGATGPVRCSNEHAEMTTYFSQCERKIK